MNAPTLSAAESGRSTEAPAFAELIDLTQEEMFGLDPKQVDEIQLQGLRYRFETLLPDIGMVRKLRDDLGIRDIGTHNDITPLCLPHTMYKSYSENFLASGRYDRLTRWLSGLTTHDLSGVDLAGCESLQGWIDRLEAQTPLKPICSSGTSGKISVTPHSQWEDTFKIKSFLRSVSSFRDEPGAGFDQSPPPPFFMPWPADHGPHGVPRMLNLFRQYVYKGYEDRFFVLGGEVDADMLWLAGRLRSATALGEVDKLALTDGQRATADRLAKQEDSQAERLDRFIADMNAHEGQRVFFWSGKARSVPLATELRARGLKPIFAPDSYMLMGGGSKGMVFPDGWDALLEEYFPYRTSETFGFSEMTGMGGQCSAGRFHMPASLVLFVLDPDTSAPAPRAGRQRGRLCVYDLNLHTRWGGFITGDEVTIDFDGGCACGRKGPFIQAPVERFSDHRADDKITCSQTPDAYERAVAHSIDSAMSVML